jgi:aspartyl-tRNA(Asn)/glutamyl-tRNA(Gln) amidotransferase subunit C
MEITEKEVIYVASLARIRFNSEEILRFTGELKNIITYFDKLNELDTNNIEAKSEVFDFSNIFREDRIEASMPREDILFNVPAHDEEYIIVPNAVD